MKIIPKFFHGVLDYVTGLLLLLAPILFGFSDVGGAAVWVMRLVGVMILLQALTTDYELGLLKTIPIRMHLMMDYVVGAFMLVAPWLFGFSNVSRTATVLSLVVGILVLGLTAMTQPRGRPREVLA